MQAPDLSADLALLAAAAEEAGQIARHYFRADPETWEKSDGAGPVTQADIEIDAMLQRTLTAARPAYGWLSEESEDELSRTERRYAFIVDPIDGTKAFIDGTTAFAHSLAIVEDGTPIVGVVYLPERDKLYTAARGLGAFLNGMPLQTSSATNLAEAEVLATRPTMTPQHWPRGVPTIKRVYRPSLAYRMALVGDGTFDGMATFRKTWEWDIAAGVVIVEEAGGIATDGQGGLLKFNTPGAHVEGILTGGAAIHSALLAARA